MDKLGRGRLAEERLLVVLYALSVPIILPYALAGTQAQFGSVIHMQCYC